MDIVIIRAGQINIGALDETLRAQLGSAFSGLSVNGERTVLHLADGTPATVTDRARQLVTAHDPAQFSASQQAEVQRQQRLEQARGQKGSELSAVDFLTNPLLLTLARKIIWLEQEINDLRDSI